MNINEDAKTAEKYFENLGENVQEKSFFWLLRKGYAAEEAMEATGYEVPETHQLIYGRGSWQLVQM